MAISLFAAARERLSQQLDWRADIAVTGLRRSGKSVFITSAIHNLISAARSPDVLLGLSAARNRDLIAAAEAPPSASDMPLFPTKAYLQAMGAEAPEWPAPTGAVFRTELAIRHKRKSMMRRLAGSQTNFALGFIDYPGEWLLDLPMMEQSFADWSRATLELLRTEPRAAIAQDFLGFLAACGTMRAADEEQVQIGRRLYQQVLHRARDELNLSFLQPGRFVMPDGKGDRPVLWFFPLPGLDAAAPPKGSLAALLAERYTEYCQKIVRPFFAETFARTNRQVVLVDLISALNNGRYAFDDTCRALDAALDALQVRKKGFLASILPARFERVLFAATKADHIPDIQRDRLRLLLESITGLHASHVGVAGAASKSICLASVRCTVDERVRLDVGDVDVVVGTPVGQQNRVKLYPGTIPATVPPPSYWESREVRFPIFRPPAFSVLPGGGLPHINLDVALNYLLEDLLR